MENQVKKLRKERNLTLEGLGELIGATKGQVSKIETGAQPLTENWIKRLSKGLDVEPWEIIKEKKAAEDDQFQQIEDMWDEFQEENREELVTFMSNLLKVQKAKDKLK